MSLKADMATLGGRYSAYADEESANPASIADNADGPIVWTISGLTTDDVVMGWSTKADNSGLQKLIFQSIDVTAANTVTMTVANESGGAIDASAVVANFLILRDTSAASS